MKKSRAAGEYPMSLLFAFFVGEKNATEKYSMAFYKNGKK